MSFNPCSLGCFPRSSSLFALYTLFNHVSILVLLDVFLEVCHRSPSDVQTGSFNPCSLGCFPRRIGVRLNTNHGSVCFNPCSLGCFPRSRLAQSVIEGLGVSILVLLDVFLEAFKPSLTPCRPWCFNPCSLGCFPRSART